MISSVGLTNLLSIQTAELQARLNAHKLCSIAPSLLFRKNFAVQVSASIFAVLYLRNVTHNSMDIFSN